LGSVARSRSQDRLPGIRLRLLQRSRISRSRIVNKADRLGLVIIKELVWESVCIYATAVDFGLPFSTLLQMSLSGERSELQALLEIDGKKIHYYADHPTNWQELPRNHATK
jgi:hypothetical protein